MNSASGIGASQELLDTFASAVDSVDVRIIKVSIKNESLVPDGVTQRSGSLQSDLKQLAGLVSTDVPAYYLVRLDSSASEWLAISYVPDTAKVRDKMLYASTRNALTKALGNDRFTDTMFATNANELTAEGYAAHLQHNSAPQPLSAREAEMASVRAAEKAAGLDAYKGASERKSHVGAVGLSWTDEVESALRDLAAQSARARNTLVLLSIDQENETLVLRGVSHPTPNEIGASLPNSEPSYAFYSWPQNGLVFIYACPPSSLIRHRMLYSAGVQSFVHNVKELGLQVSKKAETSDPSEVNEAWLKSELAPSSSSATTAATASRGFAKPRGPTRKR